VKFIGIKVKPQSFLHNQWQIDPSEITKHEKKLVLEQLHMFIKVLIEEEL